MRSVAITSGADGSLVLGVYSGGKSLHGLVLLRWPTRANARAIHAICGFAGSRQSELDSFAIYSYSRWIAQQQYAINGLLLQPIGPEMKLAETWIEDASIPTAVAAFHDEVEEVKDGCGGVAAVRVKKGSYQEQNATRAFPRNSRCRKKARKENGRGS